MISNNCLARKKESNKGKVPYTEYEKLEEAYELLKLDFKTFKESVAGLVLANDIGKLTELLKEEGLF